MLINIIYIIIGFVLLIKGADFLVDGSCYIAKKFHIPEIIIGLTIVSMGTSMPELFVSTTSAMDGLSDMAIGNVVGSNLCNLFLILGLSSILNPIKFVKETKIVEIPVCFIITLIFLVFCNTGHIISKMEAIIMLILFILFLLYTVFMGIKFSTELKGKNESNDGKFLIIKNFLLIIIGILGLKYGGDLVVEGAVYVAQRLKISDAIISLTILAIGTSLPELVTSVNAALKHNSDIAIGNILGSNIFNILCILGVTGIIQPIEYNAIYNILIGILLFGTLVLALFPFIPPKNEMSRANGIVFLILFVVYSFIMFNL